MFLKSQKITEVYTNRNNASIERIMGREILNDVNENGEELVDFYALNGLRNRWNSLFA